VEAGGARAGHGVSEDGGGQGGRWGGWRGSRALMASRQNRAPVDAYDRVLRSSRDYPRVKSSSFLRNNLFAEQIISKQLQT
jgi:hypothetical protein